MVLHLIIGYFFSNLAYSSLGLIKRFSIKFHLINQSTNCHSQVIHYLGVTLTTPSSLRQIPSDRGLSYDNFFQIS